MPDKTLDNSDINGTRQNVPDVKVFGNGDTWVLLCKASSEAQGWMKSTKVLPVPGAGCFVQVTTQQKNPDGSWAVAEAVTFAPKVHLIGDGESRRLVNWNDAIKTFTRKGAPFSLEGSGAPLDADGKSSDAAL